MKHISTLFTLLILCLATTGLYAQNVTVKGTVTDEENNAVYGATILEKGTTNGTSTDFEGKFSLEVASDATIIVRYIGYTEQEFAASGGTVNAKLEPANIELDGVVVSASKRKERILDAPASVTVLSADKIESNPVVTVTDHLTKVPSVDVMQTGLVSSNVNVRGFNNIFSGSLLTMVDYRIARVPSLRVNAYQFMPSNTSNYDKIELMRGPASALYGPNATAGVLHMISKSPLAMDTKFETTIGLNAGVGNLLNPVELTAFPSNQESQTVYAFIPEISHSGKISEKFGYRISGSYMKGYDWQFYDPREPAIGDTLVFGSVKDGQLFIPDTMSNGALVVDTFDRDFEIEKFNIDARFDFAFSKDIDLTLQGGISRTSNIELTGLGGAQGINWIYSYGQMRFRWKDLFVQYYLNSSDAGDTYLIPQVGPNADEPIPFQKLIDKSKLHVVTLQHSSEPAKDLNLVYGFDWLGTRPNTESTINGRFEENDNINQYGAYIQAEYDFSPKWSTTVAVRGDYHDVIEEYQFSPRAALVFKPTTRHTVRATYNRSFFSPSSLNLFLDLANGQAPNGINVRGIGNPYGYNYVYGDNGIAQFTSPYQAPGTWTDIGDQSLNYEYFQQMTNIIAAGLAASSNGSVTVGQAQLLNTFLFDGIRGQSGSIQNVGHLVGDYVQLLDVAAGEKTLQEALIDPTGIKDRETVESSITQTFELGYKGIIKNKAFVTLDAYYTREENYISPLLNVTGSVFFNPADLMTAVGPGDTSGQLYFNLQQPMPLGSGTIDQNLVPLLDGSATYDGTLNGTVYDELINVLMGANLQLPFGSVTPDDSLVNNDVILTYVNLGTVEVFGFDMGFNYMINDDVSINVAASMVNKDRIELEGAANGYVGLNAPKYRYAIGLDHNFPKAGIGYGLTYRWQDAFPANSAVYVGWVDAANFVDLKVTYKPTWSKNTLFSLNVNNVLDYKHQRFPGTPQIGRFTMLKVQHTIK